MTIGSLHGRVSIRVAATVKLPRAVSREAILATSRRAQAVHRYRLHVAGSLERNRGLLLHVTAVAACIAVARLVVWSPLFALIAFGLVALCIVSWVYPIETLFACVMAAALHGGLFFKLRASVLGVPLSLFDLIPLLLLICAIALRARYPSERRFPRMLVAVFWLSLGGLLAGALLGLLTGAELYQIGRVVRIETALLLVLLAAGVAGHIPEWVRALGTSLYVAGVLVAVEILVTFAWLHLTGGSIWAVVGLVDPADVRGAISSGSDVALRDLALNPYVMIPTFCFAAIRLLRRDVVTISLIMLATLFSLSRGAWFGVVVAIVAVVAFRLASSRGTKTPVLRASVSIAIAAAVAIPLAGDALSNRFDRSLTTNDASATFRERETKDVLRLLTADPGTFIIGLGAGTVTEHTGFAINPKTESSPLLENNVLSKWKNTSLLSLVAAVSLLLAGFARSWRLARVKGSPAIYAMGLSLPALGLSGLFGGTFNWVPFTGPLWLLAATIIGSGFRLSDTASAQRA